jgi:hypothetical protein
VKVLPTSQKPPQHWASEVQLSPSSLQQAGTGPTPQQMSPEQQSSILWQGVPAGKQPGGGAAPHLPFVHTPEQHSKSQKQGSSVRRQQPPLLHWPEQHSSSLEHPSPNGKQSGRGRHWNSFGGGQGVDTHSRPSQHSPPKRVQSSNGPAQLRMQKGSLIEPAATAPARAPAPTGASPNESLKHSRPGQQGVVAQDSNSWAQPVGWQ